MHWYKNSISSEVADEDVTAVFDGLDNTVIDLDPKIFLGQSVAQSLAWTCSALSILHVSNFKVLAQIL